MPQPPRFVIFDVDGVLVQSMERHYEAYRTVFAEKGVTIEPIEVFEQEGRKAPEVIRELAKKHDLPLTDEEHARMTEKKQATFRGFGPQPLYPGVRDLVAGLHGKGTRVAVVSGTYRENILNHLGDFVGRFDVVISSDDVQNTKPHPEPYLKALDQLGAKPEDAIIVENAPGGIRSGKAAGVRVLAVTSTLPEERLREAGADEVFPDIPAIARHFGVSG